MTRRLRVEELVQVLCRHVNVKLASGLLTPMISDEPSAQLLKAVVCRTSQVPAASPTLFRYLLRFEVSCEAVRSVGSTVRPHADVPSLLLVNNLIASLLEIRDRSHLYQYGITAHRTCSLHEVHLGRCRRTYDDSDDCHTYLDCYGSTHVFTPGFCAPLGRALATTVNLTFMPIQNPTFLACRFWVTQPAVMAKPSQRVAAAHGV